MGPRAGTSRRDLAPGPRAGTSRRDLAAGPRVGTSCRDLAGLTAVRPRSDCGRTAVGTRVAPRPPAVPSRE